VLRVIKPVICPWQESGGVNLDDVSAGARFPYCDGHVKQAEELDIPARRFKAEDTLLRSSKALCRMLIDRLGVGQGHRNCGDGGTAEFAYH
jgi:hypothetical protein